jgi:hypothetical protein
MLYRVIPTATHGAVIAMMLAAQACATTSKSTAVAVTPKAVATQAMKAAPAGQTVTVRGKLSGLGQDDALATEFSLQYITSKGESVALRRESEFMDRETRAFELRTTLPEPGLLLVLSEGPDGRFTALCDTAFAVNGIVALPALDVESTLETEVALTVLRQGGWQESRGLTRLRGLITPAVAEALLRAPDYGEAVRQVAQAARGTDEAWLSLLQRIGVSDAEASASFGLAATGIARYDSGHEPAEQAGDGAGSR